MISDKDLKKKSWKIYGRNYRKLNFRWDLFSYKLLISTWLSLSLWASHLVSAVDCHPHSAGAYWKNEDTPRTGPWVGHSAHSTVVGGLCTQWGINVANPDAHTVLLSNYPHVPPFHHHPTHTHPLLHPSPLSRIRSGSDSKEQDWEVGKVREASRERLCKRLDLWVDKGL